MEKAEETAKEKYKFSDFEVIKLNFHFMVKICILCKVEVKAKAKDK